MNADGDMLSTALSNGHVADIKMVEDLVKGFKARVYADRGYNLVTYYHTNMETIQLSKIDQQYLKQRSKMETLFSLLKGKYNLVTSIARSIQGYLFGIYASLCAYQICHINKPTIQMMHTSA